MDKRIIFSGDNVTVILENGDVHVKQGVSKEFIQALKECTTEEELVELIRDKENTVAGKEVKVNKSDWEKWIAQEVHKVQEVFKKGLKEYYVYEDSKTGEYKLARDILIKSKSFKERGEKVIGCLFDLYNERFNNIINSRVINI